MDDPNAPYHAHIYFSAEERPAAEALRAAFARRVAILFIGALTDGPAGPHPMPQYEVHFRRGALPDVVSMIEASGLRALVHPLTLDDRADHTSLGTWYGAPLDLDLSVLDPPGINQGLARFGRSDF